MHQRSSPADDRSQVRPPGSVDARFTLAAERTVLAWIRTALGFVAGGVALIYVTPDVHHPAIKYSLGGLMVLVGTAVAVTGGVRWRQTTRALRGGGAMPSPLAVFVLIGAIVVIAGALIVALAATGV
ncbi:YidH family protein [Gordonia sp. CPCC 205333]|uniref:YidH family protein n=1 Tax=Gordonia sp. CPCC 205333 TaxID=3140790 RepID=UPI003AF35075